MSETARLAITAAQNYKKWGRWSTTRFCERRGVPRRLLTLAVQLEATKNF